MSSAGAATSQIPTSSSAPELPGLAKDGSSGPPAASPAPAASALPPAIQDMDNLINDDVAKFVASASGLDKNIESQVLGT